MSAFLPTFEERMTSAKTAEEAVRQFVAMDLVGGETAITVSEASALLKVISKIEGLLTVGKGALVPQGSEEQ